MVDLIKMEEVQGQLILNKIKGGRHQDQYAVKMKFQNESKSIYENNGGCRKLNQDVK